MSGMASNYDIPKLGLGLGAAAGSLVLAIGAAYVFASRGGPSSSYTRGELVPFALINIAYGIMMFASSYVEEEHHFWYWAASAWLALTGWRSISSALTAASSSSSSSSSKSLDAQMRSKRQGASLSAAAVAVLVAFTAVRLLRGWNQTGQKFAGEPDLVKTFLQPSPLLLWTLVTATYATIGIELVAAFSAIFPPAVAASAVSVLVLWALSFKLVFTFEDSPELVGSFARPLVDAITRLDGGSGGPVTLVVRARIVFAGLVMATAAAIYGVFAARKQQQQKQTTVSGASTIHILLPLYTLLAVTQSRTANIPLFLLFGLVYRFLAKQIQQQLQHGGRFTPTDIATATLLLQYASFFAFGGTNAISSVDLSSAYNGIAGFSAAAVGVLIFISNWAGSIYWAVASVLLLLQLRQTRITTTTASSPPSNPWLQHASLLTVFAAASAVAVMAACTALRTHLFVWTVFSPKYLYCIAWSLGMHMGVNLALGGLLYSLGVAA